MDSNKSMTPAFLTYYTLTINEVGTGIVLLNDNYDGSVFMNPQSYASGTTAWIYGYAVNNGSNYPVTWTGCKAVYAQTTCEVDINSNTTITATYSPPITYTLTANATAGGYITGNSGTYSQYAMVGITAVPDPGYHFVTWNAFSPCPFKTSYLCAFTITGNTSLTATFEPDA